MYCVSDAGICATLYNVYRRFYDYVEDHSLKYTVSRYCTVQVYA